MGDDLWLLDTGATGHFTHDPRLLENYAECSRVLRCAGGNTFPIVGTGTLRLSLRSGEGVIYVMLVNVAHVPGHSHHLLSLRRIADAGNKTWVPERASGWSLQNPAMDPFNDWGGGRRCNKSVPVSGGNGTKKAPTGDIFEQLPGQMR